MPGCSCNNESKLFGHLYTRQNYHQPAEQTRSCDVMTGELDLVSTGWFIYRDSSTGLYIIIPNLLGSIITYNHQPTEVLNTAQMASLLEPVAIDNRPSSNASSLMPFPLGQKRQAFPKLAVLWLFYGNSPEKIPWFRERKQF